MWRFRGGTYGFPGELWESILVNNDKSDWPTTYCLWAGDGVEPPLWTKCPFKEISGKSVSNVTDETSDYACHGLDECAPWRWHALPVPKGHPAADNPFAVQGLYACVLYILRVECSRVCCVHARCNWPKPRPQSFFSKSMRRTVIIHPGP